MSNARSELEAMRRERDQLEAELKSLREQAGTSSDINRTNGQQRMRHSKGLMSTPLRNAPLVDNARSNLLLQTKRCYPATVSPRNPVAKCDTNLDQMLMSTVFATPRANSGADRVSFRQMRRCGFFSDTSGAAGEYTSFLEHRGTTSYGNPAAGCLP